MAKKRLIPFSWLPASWGLKGQSRDIAKAEYELEGKELQYALIDIKCKDGKSRDIAKLGVDLEYGDITREDYCYRLNEIENPDKESKEYIKNKLKLDLSYNKITEIEYEKEIATLNEEPWVTVIKMHVNDDGGGEFELDWNSFFIEQLHENGFIAPNDEHTVDLWFSKVCKTIALEAFEGVGDTEEELDNAEIIKRVNKGEGKWIVK